MSRKQRNLACWKNKSLACYKNKALLCKPKMNNGCKHAIQNQLFLCAYPHSKRVMSEACVRACYNVPCACVHLIPQNPVRVTFETSLLRFQWIVDVQRNVQNIRLTKLYYQQTDSTEKHEKDKTNTVWKKLQMEKSFFLPKLYEQTSYEETLKRLEDSNTIRTNWQMEKNIKSVPLGTDKRWKDKTNSKNELEYGEKYRRQD